VVLVRLLNARPRTVSEARERLRRNGFDDELTESVLRRAEAEGLLDDRTFAKLWVTDRVLHRPLSRAAIAEELRRKGVAPEVIEAALNEGYPVLREVETARELAEERFRRLRGVPLVRRRERTVNYLMRRGFSRSLAFEVLPMDEAAEDE